MEEGEDISEIGRQEREVDNDMWGNVYYYNGLIDDGRVWTGFLMMMVCGRAV